MSGFGLGNYVPGLGVVDPFAAPLSVWCGIVNAVLATAFFRCWHILLFFSAWATVITYLHMAKICDLAIQSTLLTVIGTLVGFVVSYRTTSGFERYNEGRKLWSQIILGSRTFARLVWFHVAEDAGEGPWTAEEKKARVLVEKTTIINLLLAFATSTKHYLRGEDGIYYEDLYHLVKFLPAYALPASIPSTTNLHGIGSSATPTRGGFTAHPPDGLSITITRTSDAPALTAFAHPAVPGTLSPLDGLHTGSAELFKRAPSSQKGTGDRITLSVPTTPASPRKARPGSGGGGGGGGATPLKDVGERLPRPVLTSLAPPLAPPLRTRAGPSATPLSPLPRGARPAVDPELDVEALGGLAPAHNPPAWAAFDVFPLSLLVKPGARLGKEIKGRKAMRARAKLRGENEAHNIPLEISLYLSSYIMAMQRRKLLDPSTSTALYNALNLLVDALTGLERVLTTPIPFSYSVHLWMVTTIYVSLLPFQMLSALTWLTIPATAIFSFMFFGFLVAGEEIENPFGYDKNDLNMDHFCANIIRSELAALSAAPPPDLAAWAFAPANDRVLMGVRPPVLAPGAGDGPASPNEWVRRGSERMRRVLAAQS